MPYQNLFFSCVSTPSWLSVALPMRRTARTEAKQHSDRVHLPRLIHGSQNRSYNPHHAPSAMYRCLSYILLDR